MKGSKGIRTCNDMTLMFVHNCHYSRHSEVVFTLLVPIRASVCAWNGYLMRRSAMLQATQKPTSSILFHGLQKWLG